jgi:hypothetical protein
MIFADASSRRRKGRSRAPRQPRPAGLLATGALTLLAVVAVGCSTKTVTGTGTPTPPASAPAATTPAATSPAPVATTPAATTPATPTPSAGGLSGTWTGSYSGAYSGSFSLTWQQAGTKLSGTIMISNPASTLPITGTLNGSSISFGAVGGVTYSGTVSGNSMSGNFQVPPSTTSNGTWTATRSS